ncbi:formylmethanofuran--tetrahydromethanopterin N-formyltransferase [Desulfosporosinus lacus]|uniref:Formylmethanofuran--tetrahydromethanopterin formyltransferase n=1 Tax=Desulfosporosinus lacus DSM 15449 TaxID=1121420 RepID=A0A1M5V4E8_9FIRM|nr:formylmethanofuran--tetrahydromethanopterin N-formyltransferase [Desulfosporosinus lacus]SHH70132.1 formylmethanofuran-tetrahydromethanopterin formyltransferase [Desulfosporosinus lacus DSM 15449]
MRLNGVEIENTFAEAFGMRGTRLTVTAINETWAEQAALAVTGFATSVIGCGVEAGIEGPSGKTPDGRAGMDCLFFAASREGLESTMLNRIGQAVMTAPTSACFDGGLPEIPADSDKISKYPIGSKMRFFGDGYQASKIIGTKRYWRIPVMDGEFMVQEEFTMVKAIGGGNFLIVADGVEAALKSAEAAVRKMKELRGVILPFPGGVVRSGSKVGSQYKFLTASTNVFYCPTIRGRVENSALNAANNAVMEIVIDGLTEELIGKAMAAGIRAAVQVPGVQKITAGNYGGKLGKYHFHLHKILAGGGNGWES